MNLLKTIIFLILTLIFVPLLLNFGGGFSAITDFQLELLKEGLVICLIVALVCFLVSELSKNYSQIDKTWSLVPLFYTWFFTVKSGLEPRMVLMASLVTLWGLRLSYNFYRRGGYVLKFWQGEEDYRWEVLRQKPFLQKRFNWILFNLFFISLYQSLLIFSFTLPILASQGTGPLQTIDIVLALLFVFLVIFETVADQQQYNYQEEKYRRIRNGEELTGNYKKGFVDTGLWALSRHPNYFAEQSIWVVFYFFSINLQSENPTFFNWSIVGAILLILLFYNSAKFSERITLGKYPDYKDYLDKTPRFFPISFSSNSARKSDKK